MVLEIKNKEKKEEVKKVTGEMRKKGPKFKLILIVLLALIVVAVVGAILFFVLRSETGLKLREKIGGYSKADLNNIALICNSECKIGRAYDFCCTEKSLGKTEIKCTDKRINTTCSVGVEICEQICGGEEAVEEEGKEAGEAGET